MNKINRNYKRLSIWILLFTQVLLIMSYFYMKVENEVIEKISFIARPAEISPLTYHTSGSKIFLRSINTRTKFIDFNSSLCYINGTDLVTMKRLNSNWKCSCLSSWHGKDCGQPEIIWRAFLTYQKPLKLTGPLPFERRVIYIFKVDIFTELITEIRVNELGNIIDLFILYEDLNSDFLERKLNNNFLKRYHDKILYFRSNNINEALPLIRNLRETDIIVSSSSFDIPNKYAIDFIKFYGKWPEPLRFRLRWSVFGFFWMHPKKTVLAGGACSVGYLRSILNNKIELLGRTTKGIILGDLNHYGGWFCEYCFDVNLILDFLDKYRTLDLINLKKIDSAFVEDIIENGLYIDGKTELLRTHRFRDNYFAPFYVTENNWNYEFLLTNLYSNIDYEG